MRRKSAKPSPPVQVEPANDAGAFFTPDELALRWRCHRQTVYAAIRAGQLKAFQPGRGHYRISEAEVRRYEDQLLSSQREPQRGVL